MYAVFMNQRELETHKVGELVALRIPLPTDASVTVTCDDVDLGPIDYQDGCMVRTFVMPAHDVHVETEMRNTMASTVWTLPPAGGAMTMEAFQQMNRGGQDC